MKQLKLKLAALPSAEILTRGQLKGILKSTTGGSGGNPNCCDEGTCANLFVGAACALPGKTGTCEYLSCTICIPNYNYYHCVG